MKTLLTSIILLFTFTYSFSQENIKGYRFYIDYNLSQKLQVTDKGNGDIIASEINNLGSSVGHIRIGGTYDFLSRKQTVFSVGAEYAFTGSKVGASAKQTNSYYTYRLETSALSMPIEVRHYLHSDLPIKFFLTGGIIPELLINSKLTKKEDFYDSNRKYISTTETDIKEASFNKVNASIRVGFGMEIRTKKFANVWFAPTYTYQILPIWSQTIKQNISVLGVVVGVHFRQK
jgi:Outer membrane protein beta-barrel domain